MEKADRSTMFFCRTSDYSFRRVSPEFLFSVVAVRHQKVLSKITLCMRDKEIVFPPPLLVMYSA